MKTVSKLAIGLLAAASMSTAMAQPTPAPAPHQGPAFHHKDVTRAEALAKAAERFDRVDTNKDGVLTKDERRAMRHKMRDHRGAPPRHPGQLPPGASKDHKGPPPPRDPAAAADAPPR